MEHNKLIVILGIILILSIVILGISIGMVMGEIANRTDYTVYEDNSYIISYKGKGIDILAKGCIPGGLCE